MLLFSMSCFCVGICLMFYRYCKFSRLFFFFCMGFFSQQVLYLEYETKWVTVTCQTG